MCDEQLSFDNIPPAKPDTKINFRKMSLEERFNYFENQKSILNSELTDICNEVLSEFDIKRVKFRVTNSKLGTGQKENHQHAVSVELQSSLALKIHLKNNLYRIELSKSLNKYTNFPNNLTKEMKSYPDSVLIDMPSKSEYFFAICKKVLIAFIDTYEPKEKDKFGCCGKYMDCSNERKCLHDDLFYAKACRYRKKLESGEIFYGANRNVD